MGFTEKDRKKQDDMFTMIRKQSGTIKKLTGFLKQAKDIIIEQTKHINDLRREHNRTNYRMDTQQQYGRLESISGINLGIFGNMSAEEIIFEIAKEIERKSEGPDKNPVVIDLHSSDIERCHFLGNKTARENKKKLICKFGSYKMRMKFIKNKRLINSQTTGRFKDVFICEDLTPMRSRLVWFIKNNHSDKFCNVHTMNGVIRMKEKKGTDAETADSNWLSVSNVDDLYKLLDREEDFDIVEFNKGLHGFKILPQLAINPINFELDGLVESEEEYSE